MATLARFLVELRPPKNGFEDIQSLGARSRAASEELSHNGTRVRLLRSVFIPEDGTCLLVFEGSSREAVLDACRRAAIDLEQVRGSVAVIPTREEESR
jgi:hypothetical protein